jgi:hypothetical protein
MSNGIQNETKDTNTRIEKRTNGTRNVTRRDTNTTKHKEDTQRDTNTRITKRDTTRIDE